MSNKKVSVDDFMASCGLIFDQYKDSIEEIMTDEIDSASKEALKKLKSDSPRQSGEFAKSWKRKVTGKDTPRPSATLYNDKYQLVHLLEYGHINVLWGHRITTTEGKHFVAPINDWVQSEFERRLSIRITEGSG